MIEDDKKIEQLEKMNAKLTQRVKELEEIVLSPQENEALYNYQNFGIGAGTDEMDRIVKKIMKFSVASKPNV